MGVSKIEELDETMRVWRSVLDGLGDDFDAESESTAQSVEVSDHEWSLKRRQDIRVKARKIREIIGEWADVAWASPDPGFVNQRKVFGYVEAEEREPISDTTGMDVMTPIAPPSTMGSNGSVLAGAPASHLKQQSSVALQELKHDE